MEGDSYSMYATVVFLVVLTVRVFCLSAFSFPGTSGELLTQLAAACPLSYYNLMELSCRGGRAYGHPMLLATTATKLQLAELLVGQGHQQLLPSWQHYKAYTSATASWIKTYAGVLQAAAVAAAGGVEGAAAGVTVRKGMTPAIDSLTQSLRSHQQWLLVETSQLQLLPLGAGRMVAFLFAGCLHRFELESEHSPTPGTIQLLLLVWLARAVAVTAKLLLGVVGVCRKKKKSSSSTAAGGGSRPGSSSSSGIEGGGVGCSSRGGLGPDLSAAVAMAGVATGLLALRGARHANIDSNGTTEAETSARVLSIALLQYQALVLWHQHACKAASAAAGVGGSTSTACGASCNDPPNTPPPAAAGSGATGNMAPTSAAPPAKGCGTPGVASHGMAAAGTSTPPEPAPKGRKAAATTTASSAPAPETPAVPSRIAKLPQHGLPSAVVSQLDFINSSWPHKVLSGEQQLAGEQEVEELLQDLLLLGELLVEQVPSPIGCNNPGCGDLRGLSELTASCKTCTGCGVVKYCSRACQVGHWKVHKDMCKRLQGEGE